MSERDTIVETLWQTLAGVSGVGITGRNPSKPPTPADLPAVFLFEMQDKVMSISRRGKSRSPVYTRDLTVIVEIWIQAASEAQVSQEALSFLNTVKTALYTGGNSLGIAGVEVTEESLTPLLRPPATAVGMETVGGIGMVLSIGYTEDISQLVGGL